MKLLSLPDVATGKGYLTNKGVFNIGQTYNILGELANCYRVAIGDDHYLVLKSRFE